MTILLLIQVCTGSGGERYSFNMNFIDLAAAVGARVAVLLYRGSLLAFIDLIFDHFLFKAV